MGNGQLDLATRGGGDLAVPFFPGPWVGSGTQADALGEWTGEHAEYQLGDRVEGVGDVTGDGLDDLAFCASTWGDDPYRAGRLYVVAGTTSGLAFGAADELPIQVRGGFEGEGVGFGFVGADVTGDGAQDLVVGASGVPPGVTPGAILLFPGPIAGTYESADAPIRVYGEFDGDDFGRAMATVDVDGDAQADLLVGAHEWPAREARGALYLLAGRDLAP